MLIKHKIFYLILYIIPIIYASGAYDHGTSAGKNNWDISITLNPFNLINYGQNYAILSYGYTNEIDIVNYISKHYNGAKSFYVGGLYQFLSDDLLDLSTAIGIRKIFHSNNSFDLFFPQLLYNIKLPHKYTIGGSIINVGTLLNKKIEYKGIAIDISVFKPLPFINKKSKIINDAYFGFGIFQNTEMKLLSNDFYFHYSIDLKLNFKSI